MADQSSDSDQSCLMCVQPGKLHCQECDSRYCTQACQKADWPVHKLLCKSLKHFSTPPAQDTVRTIIFQPFTSKPKFIWMQLDSQKLQGMGKEIRVFPFSESRKRFGNQGHDTHFVNWDRVHNKILNDAIEVYFEDGMLFKGSPANQSIRAACKEQTVHPWAGEVVILHKVGNRWDDVLETDHADLRDLRSAVNHLKAHRNPSFNQCVSNLGKRDAVSNQNVQGVRINCDGVMELKSQGRFIAGEVVPSHAVWKAPISQISEVIGLPLHVYRVADLPPHRNLSRANQPSTYLMLRVHPSSEYYGWGPSEWVVSRPQSAIVVRADKKPLLPLHLEVICDFCQSVISPRYADLAETLDGNTYNTHRQLVKTLNRAKFEAHYNQYIYQNYEAFGSTASKGVRDSTPSPYTV